MAFGDNFANEAKKDEEMIYNEIKNKEISDNAELDNPEEVDVFINKGGNAPGHMKRSDFVRKPAEPSTENKSSAPPVNNNVQRARFQRPRNETPSVPVEEQKIKPINKTGSFQPKGVESNTDEHMKSSIKIKSNGLDAKLDRLIDIVTDYLKKSPEEIKMIKKKALKEPTALSKEYNEIYTQKIQPMRKGRYDSLETAKREMPDQVVFMFVKDEFTKLRQMPKSEAKEKIIYDGIIIESVQYTRTPFGPASKVFAPEENEPEIINIAEVSNKEPVKAKEEVVAEKIESKPVEVPPEAPKRTFGRRKI